MRYLLLFCLLPLQTIAQWPVGVKYGNESKTYEALIEQYQALDKQYGKAALFTIGTTDVGKPLHAFIIDRDGNFGPSELKNRKKPVLFINNGIHPGEPCGIDASLMLAEQMLAGNIPIPNAQIIIIPVFNVGGMLNRSCCSRANQEGPAEYGFRGNAQNLDLNRDFVKNDAQNTIWLMRFIAERDPDVFIDTHTSNGADYQYVMTLIQSQIDKLEPGIAALQNENLTPFLYQQMNAQGYPMAPYVHTVKRTPDDGIMDYLDSPRYSTGFAASRNTLSFVSETHMWKPFEERVKSTYLLLYDAATWMEQNSALLINTRQQAHNKVKNTTEVAINWSLDTTKVDSFNFQGYEANFITSELSGLERLQYNRKAPYSKNILYYHHYKTTNTTTLPKYYIIPQAWQQVVEKLETAGVHVVKLKSDLTLNVSQTFITDYNTIDKPYEGHYLHYDTKTIKKTGEVLLYAGDYVVETNQLTNYFIGNVLCAEGVDSYFNWGFFDSVLQQKEWFSAYVFEEKALDILKANPGLKTALDKAIKKDTVLANSHWKQLEFVYQQSAYYENTVNRYPVFEYNKSLMGLLK
jgi:hypothetical protein